MVTTWRLSSARHLCAHRRDLRAAHLAVVAEFIAFRLALVGSDQELQAVFLQKLLSHVRPKVTAPSTDSVGLAALLQHGVTPQDVHHLGDQETDTRSFSVIHGGRTGGAGGRGGRGGRGKYMKKNM